MKRRTLDDWRQLIEQQQASNLPIVVFCKQHKLTTSNFYKYRTKLQINKPEPMLIKVKSVTVPQVNNTITLTHGKSQLTLPTSCEPQWLANVVKALQS